MQIDKIQTTNSNVQNLNFKALKNIKFKKMFVDEIVPQESLTKALKNSKGVKEFFEKHDGTITFTTDTYYGPFGNQPIEAIMKVSYKAKNKLFQLFSKKSGFVAASDRDLKDATQKLCQMIEKSSYDDFISKKELEFTKVEKLKQAQRNIKEQLKNNSFFE